MLIETTRVIALPRAVEMVIDGITFTSSSGNEGTRYTITLVRVMSSVRLSSVFDEDKVFTLLSPSPSPSPSPATMVLTPPRGTN